MIVISLPRTWICDGERGLDEAQQLVALAEQAHHEVVARDEDLERRAGGRRCQGALRVARGARRSGARCRRAPSDRAGAQAELLEPGAELVEAAAHAPPRAPAGRSGGS